MGLYKWLQVLGLGILVLLVVFYSGYCTGHKHCQDPNPKIDYWAKEYKTDTIWVKAPLSEKVTHTQGYKPIKPKTITQYLPEKPKYVEVEILPDSIILILDSLKKQTLKIPNSFLVNFPNNPKLIGLSLSQDTLSWDLFSSDGSSKTEYYPLDLCHYTYLYQGVLKAKEKDRPCTKSNIKQTSSNIFVNSGISTYARSFFVQGEYQLLYKKYQMKTTATYLLQPNIPVLSISAGYKIY